MPKRNALGGVDSLFRPRPALQSADSSPAVDRVRTSVYLDPEDVLLLDALQSLEFRRDRKRPDRSEIIRRAIRFYHRHLASERPVEDSTVNT